MSMANLPPHGSPTTEAEVGRRSRNHNRSEGRGGSKGKGIGHLPPPGPSASSGTSAAEGAGLGCIMAGSPAAGLSYANISLSAHLSAKMDWDREKTARLRRHGCHLWKMPPHAGTPTYHVFGERTRNNIHLARAHNAKWPAPSGKPCLADTWTITGLNLGTR